MKRNRKPDLGVYYLALILLTLIFIYSLRALSQEVRTVKLTEANVAKIYVSTRGTALSFPAKPTKVILCRSGSFGVEYVENDLALTPLSSSARSNLFVYVFGRRFSFDLVASPTSGTSLILVRDQIEDKPKRKK